MNSFRSDSSGEEPEDYRCYVTESMGKVTNDDDQIAAEECYERPPVILKPRRSRDPYPYAKNGIHYYLLPGIGDENPTGKESQYFRGGTLEKFLQDSSQAVMLHQPYARWKEQNITQQSSELRDRINEEASVRSSVILIGHSMGGLRARAALQMGGSLPQIKALVTLGTPHHGALIIQKGPSVMTYLGAVLGGATGYALGQPLLGVIAGGLGLRSTVTGITNSPAGQDLAPDSLFLKNINENSRPMRSDIVVLDVVGVNSDIDQYVASMGYTVNRSETYYKRQNISAALSLAAVVAAGFGIFSFGWGFVLAGILIAAALFILALPTFWREKVMGSNEGDAIVPEQSQYLPLSAGGNRELGPLRLPNANHTGKYGEIQLQPSDDYPDAWVLGKKLIELQHKVGAPPSPLLPWNN